ncbi:major capsid protein [Hyphobacterium sp.]|uniref:major capsid protein n=1 Tax=Hyphobacterium sp. TaxID=2004662 RepID=UPI003B52A786
MLTFNFPFTAREMTEEVRLHPKRYGLVSALGVFPLEAIPTTFVQITEDNGVINVLPAGERGGPGEQVERGRQNLKIFQIPHFPVEDVIRALDLQDRKVVMNGQEVAANLPDELSKVLVEFGRRFAISAEYLRMSALKGVIKDGAGNTLTNLFTDFGVSQTEVDFVLGTSTTDVQAKDEELRGHIEDNLLGDTMDGVICLVSPEFFGKLIQHDKITDLFKYTQDETRELRSLLAKKTGGLIGRVFNPFGGVTYVEYRASAPMKGGNERFIAANDGYAYPTGTQSTFATFGGPADTLEEVNDLPFVTEMDLQDGTESFALPSFISAELKKHGKGVDLWGEMNILPLCKQPKVLVKATTSN